jgi:hypothetical protein
MPNGEGWIGVAQAGAAAAFFSWEAILVRWAQPLSPTEVTSLRMLLGGVFVGVAAWGSGERLWLLLGEVPIWSAVAGAAITLLGVGLVLW